MVFGHNKRKLNQETFYPGKDQVEITHEYEYEKGMKIHMMSHIKVSSWTTYHILLAEFGEVPMESYALKLIMSFQQWLAHLPPLG